MKKLTLTPTAVGMVLFGLGFGAGLLAQSRTDSPQRVEQNRTDLSGAPGMEVIASIAEYKPGERLEAHLHHGVEVAYVLQGATVQMPGTEPIALATGATVFNLRDVRHGGFVVVGESPLKLFTVHAVDKGRPLYDGADPDATSGATVPSTSTEDRPSRASR